MSCVSRNRLVDRFSSALISVFRNLTWQPRRHRGNKLKIWGHTLGTKEYEDCLVLLGRHRRIPHPHVQVFSNRRLMPNAKYVGGRLNPGTLSYGDRSGDGAPGATANALPVDELSMVPVCTRQLCHLFRVCASLCSSPPAFVCMQRVLSRFCCAMCVHMWCVWACERNECGSHIVVDATEYMSVRCGCGISPEVLVTVSACVLVPENIEISPAPQPPPPSSPRRPPPPPVSM